MADNFDMETFRIGKESIDVTSSIGKRSENLGRIYKTKAGELFLKGPIPRMWLQSASSLPGKALHVGIELWFYAGLTKSKTLSLNLSRLMDSGISRDSARRGLLQLERSKLVKVVRHAGRKPIITILIKQQRNTCTKKKCANLDRGQGKQAGIE